MRQTNGLLYLMLITGFILTILSGCGIKRKVPPAPDTPEKKMENPIIESGEGEVARPTEENLMPDGASSVSEEDIFQGFGGAEPGMNDEQMHTPMDIFFEFDKSTLSPVARESLADTARWMNANPSARLRIEGHADERGTSEYNIALGDSRAETAKRYLVNLGIASRKLSTLSYGEEMPLDPDQTEGAFAKNRRVHFEIVQ